MKKLIMGLLALAVLCGCQKDEQNNTQKDEPVNIQEEVNKAFEGMELEGDFQEIDTEKAWEDYLMLLSFRIPSFEAAVAKTIYEDNEEAAHMIRNVKANDFQGETMEAHIEVDGIAVGDEPLHFDIYAKDHEYYLDFDSNQQHILWDYNTFYTNEGFIFLWGNMGEIKEASIRKDGEFNTYKLEMEIPTRTSRRFIGISDIFDQNTDVDKLTIYLEVNKESQIEKACNIFYGEYEGKEVVIKEVVEMKNYGIQDIDFPKDLTSWEDYEI